MPKKTTAVSLVHDNGAGVFVRAKKKPKKSPNRVTFTKSKKATFLRHLSQSCNVQQSADDTGVSVDTVYRHRKIDNEFKQQWAEAIEIAYDELMLEMLRRARYGTEKPIIYGGKKVGAFNDLNDTMAMRLLSMHLANVASHKTEKKENMTNSDDTYQALMQRIQDIKLTLNGVAEVKSLPNETAIKSAQGDKGFVNPE